MEDKIKTLIKKEEDAFFDCLAGLKNVQEAKNLLYINVMSLNKLAYASRHIGLKKDSFEFRKMALKLLEIAMEDEYFDEQGREGAQ